jgi:glycosyltransferase involved in cell wall biosynthesis
MNLLVFTQKIDRNDSTLGFFHSWIEKLSGDFETISVICLEKGDYDLPKNVTVYSLGKESGLRRLGYLKNLYNYLSLISGTYDRVFVHMNEEYVLLCGLYWKLKRIPVYLWRNHPKGNLKTLIAVLLSNKVFCTSKKSFTAKFKRTVLMPVGVDTEVFKQEENIIRKKYSICMVGRISPVKNIHIALESIVILKDKGVQASLNIIGPIPKRDQEYAESLEKFTDVADIRHIVNFVPGLIQTELVNIYNSNEIILNLTEEGSFDKTIVEGSACGTIPIVSGASFKGLLPEICITRNNKEDVAIAIERILQADAQVKIKKNLEDFVSSQSLLKLTNKLMVELK